MAEAAAGKLPVGPVYDLTQALQNPFVDATGMVPTVPHPANPELRVLSNPIRVDGSGLRSPVCASLGADNEKLLPKRAYAAVDGDAA